jgi:hypothetical protein
VKSDLPVLFLATPFIRLGMDGRGTMLDHYRGFDLIAMLSPWAGSTGPPNVAIGE